MGAAPGRIAGLTQEHSGDEVNAVAARAAIKGRVVAPVAAHCARAHRRNY